MQIDPHPIPTVKPLKIVHYLPAIRLSDGGIVRAVLDWCAVFARRGHHVTLLAIDGEDIPKEWLTNPTGLPRAIIFSGGLSGEALNKAETIIQSADVLHLHAPWLAGNRRFANIATRHHVPYLVTIHGMLDDWSMNQKAAKKWIYMAIFGRRFLNAAACIHFSAEAEATQASRWHHNPRTLVLPNLIDLSNFKHLPGPEAGLQLVPPDMRMLPRILFLSRLHEKKGVDVLIRATGKLRDAGLAFVLLIAGAGEATYFKYLSDLAAELRLEDRVRFLDLVTGATKISLYQAADLFVLPTQQENFGLVLVEALACGTPVVTTRGTDIWQEIQNAGGVIVEQTPDAIAAAIRDLLADSPSLIARGKRGQQWVNTTLDVETLARRHEVMYRQTAETRPTARGA